MKLKYYQKALFPILIAVFALRCAELVLLIEPGSAYYKTGDVYHYIFNAIYLIAAVFFFSAYFFFSKKTCGADFLSKKAPGKKAAFLLAGICFAAAAANQTVSLFTETALTSVSDIFKNLKFYIALFYIISAVALIIISFCKDNATLRNPVFKVTVLALPILYVLRLFDLYIESEGLISKTFGAFEVLLIALSAICLMAFSRAFISDCRRKNFSVFLWTASVFASIRLADTVIAMIRNDTEIMSVNIIQNLADILLIIALLLINNDFYRKKRRKTPNMSSEEIPAAEGEGEYLK